MYYFFLDYVCPQDKIKCADHTCVWGNYCDGWENCADGVDEDKCGGTIQIFTDASIW